MMQQAQLADGQRANDLRNAAVVLESRGLKKIYGTGEKSISVLADANLILRQGEMVCDRSALGSRQKYFAPPARRARHADERYSILRNESH